MPRESPVLACILSRAALLRRMRAVSVLQLIVYSI
jgi:hypothetical protein